MIHICAWCGSQIGIVASSRFPESTLSHGICQSCYDNIRFQEGAPLAEYLDSLPEPVYVVNGDGVVKDVNRAGCRMLGKEPGEIVRHRGGDVFECSYARLPGGCGRTVHCSGCTIRRAVMQTFETGAAQGHVPAVLNHEDGAGPTPVRLTITTVKVQGVVLLRVDEVAQH
jgi:PAS domain-containing protein